MEIKLFPLLSTRSQRSMLKNRSKLRNKKTYNPHYNLIRRLADETGMSEMETRQQLLRERQFMLKIIDISKKK